MGHSAERPPESRTNHALVTFMYTMYTMFTKFTSISI